MNTPYDRPREPLDLAEIAIFNAGVMFSRLAYDQDPQSTWRQAARVPRKDEK